ncbi:hypothetical protein [Peribacillus aracenensis]|uniref:hypothetical protein n=1 Tax=Peribacillus aracenensis TaxID=2976708 RepID=UPI0021A28D56|nr:hypothetical protein [Peribacillus sp. BBB004]
MKNEFAYSFFNWYNLPVNWNSALDFPGGLPSALLVPMGSFLGRAIPAGVVHTRSNHLFQKNLIETMTMVTRVVPDHLLIQQLLIRQGLDPVISLFRRKTSTKILFLLLFY